MSAEWKSIVSRRPLLMALGTLAGIGVAGGILYEGTELLHHRYSGPYTGLLSGLGDVDSAAVVGRAVLAQVSKFDPHRAARELQDAVGHQLLADILTRQAGRGETIEVQGWVLPQALALLCALAAKAT